MKNVTLRFLGLVLLALSAVAQPSAPDSSDKDGSFTAKELRQGFRDRVILARPRAADRDTAEAAEAREGIRVREKLSHVRDLRIIDLSDSDTAEHAIARLRATGRYEFVEPDYIRTLSVEPNDPFFANGGLWQMRNTGQLNGVAGADIRAVQAWDIIREAPSVVVAVIDSGVNLTHEDIVGNLWINPSPRFGDINGARFLGGQVNGSPLDDNGHGTHIAGIIGATGNNNLGVTGVAWRVQIMAVKVFPASGNAAASDIVRGINYAIANRAHIINASYGAAESNGFSDAEFAAISAARDAGIVFVAAAGNSAGNLDNTRTYPANHTLDNIIAVGASTRRDEVALYSNFGAAVDLFAPGSEIISLDFSSNNGTARNSGTSMAAPHVAGAIALLKARFPTDTYRQLINRLLRGVDSGERFVGRAHTGGRLNLLAALQTTSNRPFNDDFASRPRFSGDNHSFRSNNVGATSEGGEPAHAGNNAVSTLWWEWTASTTAAVTMDTSGSGYDTVLAVYTGSALNALTLVASNDNDVGRVTSRVAFTAQAGRTYQIAVDGRGGATGLTLLSLGSTPANDAFAAPVIVTGESAHISATNARCSLESGEPRISGFAGGTSLWYRWTAPRSGSFQFSAASSDFSPILAVYTGSSLTSLSLVDAARNTNANTPSNGATWTFNAVGGTPYLVSVDTKDARSIGQFTLSVTDAKWQFRTDGSGTGGAITGAPSIARDGTVYFGSTDRSIYAVNPDGTLKWSFETVGSIDTCSPAIADDGTVYIGVGFSGAGAVYAFEPNGTIKWTRTFGTNVPAVNSPAIGADGTIYIKPGDGYLYALQPSDGATKWRFNVNGATSYASPAIARDGTIYQGSEDRRLYAINPDGTQRWVFTADNDIFTVPAIDTAGNLYFTVLNTGKLFSITSGGTLRWTYSGATLGSSSSPVLSPDGATVYFGGYDQKLHAVNTSNGAARWAYTLADEVRASTPAVDANGNIYIGCYDFRIYSITPTGTLRRTYDTGNLVRSCPTIYANTLYVGSNDRKLYAFDLGIGPGTGPWPQYRYNARHIGRALPESFAITVQPQSQAAVLGLPLTLSVVATGEGTLIYQWFRNGIAIPGATSSSYTVTISGIQGITVSAPAIITTETASPGRLINLSVRTTAGTGAQILIVGFNVTGSPDKAILVRAIGPSLTQFGLTGVLEDPRLTLFSGNTQLVANDNWATPVGGGGSTAIANAFTVSGAFPLSTASLDAALVRTMSAGSYSAQVSGPAGATGLALAELYDTAPNSGARLTNVSARAQVGTGGSILIAGFTISGNLAKRVLIRGIGPGLSQFGVPAVLIDPQLEVFRGTTKVDESDNWAANGAAALTTAFGQVGAFSLPVSSADAALVATLAPGNYTAQVSGIGGITGVALVEIYELP